MHRFVGQNENSGRHGQVDSPEYAQLLTRESVADMVAKAMDAERLTDGVATEELFHEAERILQKEVRCLPPRFGADADQNGQRVALIRVDVITELRGYLAFVNGQLTLRQAASSVANAMHREGPSTTGLRRPQQQGFM